jgi:hypothetical protein
VEVTNIECKLHREGGTHAEVGGIDYHFVPQEDGAHVCAVANPDHADRFLSITDAYRLYRGALIPVLTDIITPVAASAPAVVAAAQTEPSPGTILTSSVHPESFTIGGATYTLSEIADSARVAAGMSADDWAQLSDDTRAEFIDEKLDALAQAAEAIPAIPAAQAAQAAEPASEQEAANDPERAALVEAHRNKFGVKPHWRWSLDRIREALAE